MRVLIVEDDARLAGLLERALREQRYAVDVAADGDAGSYLAAVNDYDAIILDLMLPKKSGLDVCRDLRARGSRAPILMLTARDTVADRVTGLDSGADDYLTKPFELTELMARLRALLRRGPELLPSRIAVGPVVVDTRGQRVERSGEIVPLTAKEYALVEYLARHAGRVVGRAELCEHIWDENHDPMSNAIEVYVNRVRRKLGPAGKQLRTRRGSGYVLDESAEDRMTVATA